MTEEMFDLLSYMKESISAVDKNINGIDKKYDFEYPIITVVSKAPLKVETATRRNYRGYSFGIGNDAVYNIYTHEVIGFIDEEFSKSVINEYKKLDCFSMKEQKKDMIEKYIAQAKLENA